MRSDKKFKPTTSAPKKSQKNTKKLAPGSPTSTQAPLQPKPGSREFRKLQKQWYKVLEADGFHDLEKFDATGEAFDQLSAQSLRSIATYYDPITERYYAKLRNYLTHRPNWSEDSYTRFVAKHYTAGIPYRGIVKLAREAGYTARLNIFSVHRVVKRFEKRALRWNRTCVEGMDYIPDIG